MKIQYIAIIFIIIILPLTLLLGYYMQLQITNLNYQLQYDTKLFDSTKDGIKAFELNTVNNRFSQVADSLKRDVEASINSFITSLANNLGVAGTLNDDLLPYIPATVFTLYDGYYIYSPTWAEVLKEKEIDATDIDGQKIKITTEEGTNEYDYENLLKPYIYYTTRYIKGASTDFIVNYTLDNYMIVYGNIQKPGTSKSEYITKSGFLSSLDYISFELDKAKLDTILKRKILEYILPPRTLDNMTQAQINEAYNSADFNKLEEIDKISLSSDFGQALLNEMLEKGTISGLKDKEIVSYLFDSTINEIFETDVEYISTDDGQVIDEIIDVFSKVTYYDEETKTDIEINDSDAKRYYIKSLRFTMWANEYLGEIQAGDAVDEYGNPIEEFKNSDQKIFNTSYSRTLSEDENRNNPEILTSPFEQHRMRCIQFSIQSNLNAAISQYNVNFFRERTYSLTMPVLNPNEWESVTNNVSLITFLQGLQIGTKVYNNYAVVSSNKNQETINVDDIYYVDTSSTGVTHYHRLDCENLSDKEPNTLVGMKNIDYDLYKEEDEDNNRVYTYHEKILNLCKNTNIEEIYGCYYCIINRNYKSVNKLSYNKIKAKYTAIAKERNNLYKVNEYYNVDILSTYVAPPVTVLGTLATQAELGDYVNYSAGGYNNWRVLTKNEDSNTVTIISDGCVDSANLIGRELESSNGFSVFSKKVEEKLSNYSKEYMDEVYSVSARVIGSNLDGSVSSSASDIEITDVVDMRRAKVIQTNNNVSYTSGYWLLSIVNDNDSYNVMAMSSNEDELTATTLYNNGTNYSKEYGVRIVVTLSKDTMVYGGSGTSVNPWELIIE